MPTLSTETIAMPAGHCLARSMKDVEDLVSCIPHDPAIDVNFEIESARDEEARLRKSASVRPFDSVTVHQAALKTFRL